MLGDGPHLLPEEGIAPGPGGLPRQLPQESPYRVLVRPLGRDDQAVIRAAKAGDWSQDAEGVVTCGGVVLAPGEYALETVVSGEEFRETRAAVTAIWNATMVA